MMQTLLYILVGLITGAFSGLVGIGGGIILVPALVLIFGFSQHQAQGTTLAMMVPPIGILAAWTYYKLDYVNIPVALLLCAGFILGSLIGARLSVGLDEIMLKRIFGMVLLIIAIKMLVFPK